MPIRRCEATAERSSVHWIKVMIKSQIIPEQKFSKMQQEVVTIIKILTATINKLKSK